MPNKLSELASKSSSPAAAPRRTGLMGHVIADFPTPEAVRQMIAAMVASGVEVIEIQIPFSEPMADGPVFLAANHAALARGVDYAAAIKLMRESAQAYPQVAFIFMSYLNVVYQRGYAAFVGEAVASGAQGVIVPDLPVEHAAELEGAGASSGFANIRIVAPNADKARMQRLAQNAKGFFYAVARQGVTGATSDFHAIKAHVAKLRQISALPVAVGFGVSSGSDVRELSDVADLVIVGTASLRAYQAGGLGQFEALWRDLAAAVAVT